MPTGTDDRAVPIHMIVGNTGAGKSTYAARLAAEIGAHVFAVDEWMRVLFFPDMPAVPSYDWALERTRRIDARIIDEARRLTGLGVRVILDLGFFGRDQRDLVRGFFAGHGIAVRMHYLDIPKQIRWQRVDARNGGTADTYQFEVSRETFEFCETIFERPGADELRGAVLVGADGVAAAG